MVDYSWRRKEVAGEAMISDDMLALLYSITLTR